MKTTAAIQLSSKAMVTTWKIERVYSPVPDCAVAIGRPVTRSQAEITSRTENPVPLPRLEMR